MTDPASDCDLDPEPIPRGRARLTRETWDEVREAYLAGWSAPQLCARYGMGLSAFRERARIEGWRREDHEGARLSPAWRDPDDDGPSMELRCEGDVDMLDDDTLFALAGRRMRRAVLRGQAVEALRWRRIAQAYQPETPPPPPPPIDLRAIRSKAYDQGVQAGRLQRKVEAMLAEMGAPGVETLAEEGWPRADAPDASDASDGVFALAHPPREACVSSAPAARPEHPG